MSAEEWDALMQTEVDATQLDRDASAFATKTSTWHEACYLWSVVSMIMYVRAKASSMDAKKRLYYCQAVDVPDRVSVDSKTYTRMLQEPSLSNTKRLPGLCLLHVGMRVRLTATVLSPWAVQDSAGEVVAMSFSPEDAAALRAEGHIAATSVSAEYALRALPVAVYVKLDEVDVEFLPPTTCSVHAVAGFDSGCPNCKKIPGVVVVKPLTRAWHYTDTGLQISTAVKRTQLPIMPEKACSLYSLQGATCDPGLIAHFDMPKRADPEIKWLIAYVMLSRVRRLSCLASAGLSQSIRDIIEAGPPTSLLENYERLFKDKIRETARIATESRVALGW